MLVFGALAVTFAVVGVARPDARARAPRGARGPRGVAPATRLGRAGSRAARVDARGGRGARPPALARRRERRRRRLLPPRARPEAPRVRRPLAGQRERVPGRRAPPRVRLPALARVPRARREGVGRRPRRRRPARPDGARAARRPRRVRGRLGALPARPGRGRGRRGRRRVVAMAPGHGGAFTALALPATGSRQLLVPAALALALEATRRPVATLLASAAAASLVLAVVHPTYALFLWIPFAGFLAVRWLWERRDARSGGLALAALVVPAALFFAWLLPVIGDTESVSPDAAERDRAFEQYAGQLDGTLDRFSVAPELFGRTGAVAVAGLLLLPLAGLAARRRWAAYVVGGSLAVFAICLVPWLFTPFADVVSLSQARQAGRVPAARVRARGRDRRPRAGRRPRRRPARAGRGILLQLAFTRATSATRSRTAARRGRRGSRSPARSRRSSSASGADRRSSGERRSRPRSSSCRRTSTASRTGRRRRRARRARSRTASSPRSAGRARRRDGVRRSGGELPAGGRRADPRLRRPARPRRRHGRQPAARAGARVRGANWIVVVTPAVARHCAAAAGRPPGRSVGVPAHLRALRSPDPYPVRRGPIRRLRADVSATRVGHLHGKRGSTAPRFRRASPRPAHRQAVSRFDRVGSLATMRARRGAPRTSPLRRTSGRTQCLDADRNDGRQALPLAAEFGGGRAPIARGADHSEGRILREARRVPRDRFPRRGGHRVPRARAPPVNLWAATMHRYES